MTIIAVGLLGWLTGSAGNWAADRLPRFRQGMAEDAASSAAAGRAPRVAHYFTLPWYVARRGVCPHCGETRSLRAPLLEFATVATFLLAWWRLRSDPLEMGLVFLYLGFLLTVLVIDYERRLVLNVMLAPAALLALLASILPGGISPLQSLAGGGVGFGLFLILALIGRGKMGWGDVKLAGVIGLMTGYPLALPALILGIILGGVAALILLITRRAGRKSTMAYAPYLALGAMIMLLV